MFVIISKKRLESIERQLESLNRAAFIENGYFGDDGLCHIDIAPVSDLVESIMDHLQVQIRRRTRKDAVQLKPGIIEANKKTR